MAATEWLTRRKEGLRSWGKERAAIITVVGAVVAAVIGALVAKGGDGPVTTASQGGPGGSIDEPGPGQEIRAVFDARGTIGGVADDHHVWLMLRVANSVYPTEPEIRSRGPAWSGQFSEPTELPQGDVSLVLLDVDQQGQVEIMDWLTAVDRGEGPAGLANPIGDPLDVVSNITLSPVTSTPSTTTSTTTTSTTTSTTIPPPPPPSELESAAGGGESVGRSEASNEATLRLKDSESATLDFSVTAAGSYRLLVRYSNDNFGPLETVTVSVDEAVAGVFQAHDTGDRGYGWNVFVESPAVGPVRLAAGRHELGVTVTGGDGYGVELDVVRLTT